MNRQRLSQMALGLALVTLFAVSTTGCETVVAFRDVPSFRAMRRGSPGACETCFAEIRTPVNIGN
jgi:hypothetical protein